MKKTNKKKRGSQIQKNASAQKSLQQASDDALLGELQQRAQNKQSNRKEISVLIEKFSALIPPIKLLLEHAVKSLDKEQRHRHKLENVKTNASIEAERRGQWFALITVLASLACAVFFFISGNLLPGGFFFFGSLFFSGSLFRLAHLFLTDGKKDR
ncbi:MAG: hypothetical protein MPL62_17715 [Alphaproteobacteria bacterium]|nr:hypothetical protein [Alphaproteobacteria bacterium]